MIYSAHTGNQALMEMILCLIEHKHGDIIIMAGWFLMRLWMGCSIFYGEILPFHFLC